MSTEPILSLCMVVKDEETNLADCLRSVVGAVDEIIVVDTGSQDRTPDVAREFGARVYPFQWVNDFSAARNFSIEMAGGQYVIWMDADDRLRASEREKLKSLKFDLNRKDPKEAYYLRVINVDLTGRSEFVQLRLFPRIPGARFEGRIHEQIYHVLHGLGIRLTHLDLVIDHVGYDDPESKRTKALRNLGILMEDLSKGPDNPYLHFHIANTYSVLGEHEKAIEHYGRIKSLPNLETRFPGALSRVLLEEVATYHKLGNLRQAEKNLIEHNLTYPDTWLGPFLLAELYVQQNRWEEAHALLSKLSEEDVHAGIFPLPLDDIRFNKSFYMGQCQEHLSNLEEAKDSYSRALLQRPDDPEAEARLARLHLMSGDNDEAVRLYEKIASRHQVGAEVLCNLGVAYKRAGRKSDALTRYTEALQVDEGHPATRVNLGFLLLQMGQLVEACRHFQRVLDTPGDWLDVRLALAQIYWTENELDSFIAVLDQLLELLGLPRDKKLERLDDLTDLVEEIQSRLTERGHQKESLLAMQLGQRIGEEIAEAQARSAS